MSNTLVRVGRAQVPSGTRMLRFNQDSLWSHEEVIVRMPTSSDSYVLVDRGEGGLVECHWFNLYPLERRAELDALIAEQHAARMQLDDLELKLGAVKHFDSAAATPLKGFPLGRVMRDINRAKVPASSFDVPPNAAGMCGMCGSRVSAGEAHTCNAY